MEDILLTLIFICLCMLAWASVFIWNNSFCAVAFSACIFVCLWGWEGIIYAHNKDTQSNNCEDDI